MVERFEDSEILVHHIPHVINRLDELFIRFNESPYKEKLRSADGSKLVKFIENQGAQILRDVSSLKIPHDIEQLLSSCAPFFSEMTSKL